jgi:hypothetical protein
MYKALAAIITAAIDLIIYDYHLIVVIGLKLLIPACSDTIPVNNVKACS